MELRILERRIFKDNYLEEQFQINGYVVIPFDDEQLLTEIKQNISSQQPSDSFGGFQDTLIGKQSFHVTFFDSNVEYRKFMFGYTKEVLNNFIEQHFVKLKCAQANVFLKNPGAGEIKAHQNLTIVDETKYKSCSFWLPLQDTDKNNGTVHLIPKSHKHFVKYRNTNTYWPYTNFFASERGRKYFETIAVKKGEILIMDDRIVHYTGTNNTKESRWVLHSLWLPNEAELHYFNCKENLLETFLVEDDFWQYYLPGTIPGDHRSFKISTFDENKYNENELIALLEKTKN